MKKVSMALFVLSLLFICSCGGRGGNQGALLPADLGWVVPQTDPNNITTLPGGEEISSELISISIKDGIVRDEVEEIANEIGGVIAGELPNLSVYYIKFSPPRAATEIEVIVNELRANPSIDTASPEYVYEINSVFPSTTDIEKPGLLSEDQKWGFIKTNIPQAWEAIRRSGRDLSDVVVAVIDSGFDLGHPDLRENFVSEVNGKCVYDFGSDDLDVFYDVGYQQQSHGTYISGIIASVVNGKGMNGIAPMVKIFPLKVTRMGKILNDELFTSIYLDNALTMSIYWAALAKVDVINLSLADYLTADKYRQTPQCKAIRYALEKNIVIVAAAGNDGKEASCNFPSAADGVISVGAIDRVNERSIWPFLLIFGQSSNWSDSPKALWIAAPGTGIYTTDINSNYQYADGTSIAAPFVSGLAALMKQVNPALTNTEVANIIRETGDDITVRYPDDSEHSWKKMNAVAAINRVLGKPEQEAEPEPQVNTPPTAAIASPADGSVFTEGSEIAFAGNGNDPEEGELTGEQLVWVSDKDGQIGTGGSFTTAALSVNTHTITLTAADSQGLTDSDQIGVIIEEKQEQPSSMLTVNKIGSGTITSNPPGIDCGDGCSARYPVGTTVSLTAVADNGWGITGWEYGDSCISQNCTSLQQICELDTLRSNDTDSRESRSCSAIIEEHPQTITITFERGGQLNVTTVGSGIVTSSPAGIDCQFDCKAFYFLNGNPISVILTATPAIDATFLGWAGDCSGTGDCTLVMDQKRDVAATFTPEGYYILSVNKIGSGSIVSIPSGIDCGDDCSEVYQDGMSVTLTATADSGWYLTDFTVSGKGEELCELDFLHHHAQDISPLTDFSCTLTINATKTATFDFRTIDN